MTTSTLYTQAHNTAFTAYFDTLGLIKRGLEVAVLELKNGATYKKVGTEVNSYVRHQAFNFGDSFSYGWFGECNSSQWFFNNVCDVMRDCKKEQTKAGYTVPKEFLYFGDGNSYYSGNDMLACLMEGSRPSYIKSKKDLIDRIESEIVSIDSKIESMRLVHHVMRANSRVSIGMELNTKQVKAFEALELSLPTLEHAALSDNQKNTVKAIALNEKLNKKDQESDLPEFDHNESMAISVRTSAKFNEWGHSEDYETYQLVGNNWTMASIEAFIVEKSLIEGFTIHSYTMNNYRNDDSGYISTTSKSLTVIKIAIVNPLTQSIIKEVLKPVLDAEVIELEQDVIEVNQTTPLTTEQLESNSKEFTEAYKVIESLGNLVINKPFESALAVVELVVGTNPLLTLKKTLVGYQVSYRGLTGVSVMTFDFYKAESNTLQGDF